MVSVLTLVDPFFLVALSKSALRSGRRIINAVPYHIARALMTGVSCGAYCRFFVNDAAGSKSLGRREF